MRPRFSKSLTNSLSLFLLLIYSLVGLADDGGLMLSKPLSIKWRYETEQTSNFTPATDGKTVYLPLANGTLVALDAADGKLRWKAEAGGEFSAAPIVDEHVVYVATEYPG